MNDDDVRQSQLNVARGIRDAVVACLLLGFLAWCAATVVRDLRAHPPRDFRHAPTESRR